MIRSTCGSDRVQTLITHGDVVVLSAARPGQGGEGHLNEQPPSYWIRKFNRHGFPLDDEATAVLQGTGDSSNKVLVFQRDAPGGTYGPVSISSPGQGSKLDSVWLAICAAIDSAYARRRQIDYIDNTCRTYDYA